MANPPPVRIPCVECESERRKRFLECLGETSSFLAGLFLLMDEKDARREKVIEASRRIEAILSGTDPEKPAVQP